jgi:hypothetical protein
MIRKRIPWKQCPTVRLVCKSKKVLLQRRKAFISLRTSEIHLFYNLQLFYWWRASISFICCEPSTAAKNRLITASSSIYPKYFICNRIRNIYYGQIKDYVPADILPSLLIRKLHQIHFVFLLILLGY